MAQQHARQVAREQRLQAGFIQHEGSLQLIPRAAQTTWLDDQGDAAAATARGQFGMGQQRLLQLIGTDGHQLHLGVGRVAAQVQRALLQQLATGLGVQLAGHLAFRHHQAAELTTLAVERLQGSLGAVGVDREQHPRGVGHFAEQRFADGRVLVRLLVLGVLPGVRRHDQGHGEPARRLAEQFLVAGKDRLLAQQAEHLHGERP